MTFKSNENDDFILWKAIAVLSDGGSISCQSRGAYDFETSDFQIKKIMNDLSAELEEVPMINSSSTSLVPVRLSDPLSLACAFVFAAKQTYSSTISYIEFEDTGYLPLDLFTSPPPGALDGQDDFCILKRPIVVAPGLTLSKK